MGAGGVQFARTVSECVLTSQFPDDVSVMYPQWSVSSWDATLVVGHTFMFPQ